MAAFTSMITFYFNLIADFLASDPIIYIFGAFVLLVVVDIVNQIIHIR